ncbi:hypothetical protein [Streptomyces sp. ME19-01-6]|uniref:hypothetical protein n=1 Tax=Streptomyces sp. ME19-01-6 TaxID=3028686 RepID=UPI0029B43F29|nr:hypothetical protein [Streptomyces sp. ME19-01-6]MDX3227728.1 hypothetical protein [Streptomyces sp. ME19-01-6]
MAAAARESSLSGATGPRRRGSHSTRHSRPAACAARSPSPRAAALSVVRRSHRSAAATVAGVESREWTVVSTASRNTLSGTAASIRGGAPAACSSAARRTSSLSCQARSQAATFRANAAGSAFSSAQARSARQA